MLTVFKTVFMKWYNPKEQIGHIPYIGSMQIIVTIYSTFHLIDRWLWMYDCIVLYCEYHNCSCIKVKFALFKSESGGKTKDW